MLKTYHSKCKNLLKSHPKIPDKKLVEFRRSSKALFDIATCKCKDIKNCICPRIKKIPVWEQNFLIDQRTSRKMVIGSIDIDMTNQMRNTMKRKLARQKLQCNSQTEIIEKLNISISSTSSEYDSEGDNKLQKQSQPPKTVSKPKSTIKIDYALLSKTCDRYRVSELGQLLPRQYCIMQTVIVRKLLTKISFAESVKNKTMYFSTGTSFTNTCFIF